MLYIINHYKKLFTSFIISYQVGGNEGLSADVNEAVESGDVLTINEYKALLEKYKNDEEGLNKAVAEGIDGQLYKDARVLKVLEKYSNLSQNIKEETIVEKKQVKEEVENNKILFTRKLEKGVENGEDVALVQQYLIDKGFLKATYINKKGEEVSSADGSFGKGTENALKKFQKSTLGFNKPDGILDLNGKSMRYIVNDINQDLTHSQKEIKYGPEAEKVVDELNITQKYIDAFDKSFGGKGDIISRHNGLIVQLSRLFKLQDNDLERLYDQLEGDDDFNKTLKHLEGNLDKDKLAKELGLDKNSEKFDSGVKRTLIIALVSLVISGGSVLALEVGAINYGSNLKKGPEIDSILKGFGIDVNFKEDYRDMLLSKETTKEGVEAVLEAMNDMDTANLKRFMDEVFQPNWFQSTFGIFMPDGYSEVENLIKKFDKTGNTEDAKNVVRKIYQIAHMSVENATVEYSEAKKAYDKIPNDIKKEASDDSSFLKGYDDEDYKTEVTNANFAIRRYESAEKELIIAKEGLAHIGAVSGRYTNLDAKYDQIMGEKFDVKKARDREHQIDKVMGVDKLKKIGINELNSSQSFFKPIDREQLSDKEYMSGLLSEMKEGTINDQTSVLSGLIRGIEQNYGISFSPEEFENAFINTAEKVDKKDIGILSNLGRDRNQKFQGNIGNGELFKININGTDVYFKDKCTNIVTVVNNMMVTVDSVSSVPIVIAMNTGVDNIWNRDGGTPGTGNDGDANSLPVDNDIPITNPDGGIPTVGGNVPNL